ncbi:GPP34 family phosphoprotein [Flexivirga sp. ID2601S]|uniref:GPP34 family phosphoprotein n=1 Tax=Flexivirga aerilata TaxID=1656889 RepID=A0A849AMK0_9MICO|nr:GPP34 family phosphoprotein [Flexivirga aerilata]NNG39580.1 GPP34 family phosphoprotein [Flexivirga aerilata]
MLICCEVLLAATSPAGKRLAGGAQLDLALAGGVLTELAAHQRVAVKGSRLVVLDERPGGDPLLDHALAIFAQGAGKKPEKVLPRLAKGMTDRVYDRLVADGAVRRDLGGFLRPTRHPVVDAARREAVLRAGRQVLAGTARPDLHSGSLIALLTAADAVTTVYYAEQFGVSARELKKRAKAVGAQDWAAGAAEAAIRSAQHAVSAALATSAVAANIALNS